MKLPQLKQAKVSGKRVFLRADLDVPLKVQSSKFNPSTSSGLTLSEVERVKVQSYIEDDTRLIAALPTIEYLLKHGAKVIIAGHLGRPKGIDKGLSLKPIAKWLDCHPEFISGSKMLKPLKQVQGQHDTTKTKLGDFDGWQLGEKLFLLENLRFYEGEEKNPSTSSGQEFAKKLASLAEIYVNDAFAASHRAHASIVGVAKLLPHYAGFRLQKEVEVLSGILEHPKRPLVVLIGGAKIETKLPLVEKMHKIADYVLVGGKIAKEIKVLLKVQNEKFKGRRPALLIADLNQEGTDITPKSIDHFLQIISLAKTVVWNGPIGKTQDLELITENSEEDTERGTRELAKGIVKSRVYTLVGGGDTVAFLKRLNLLNKFSFVSTGGGAMLEFLSGEKLPGLVALTKT